MELATLLHDHLIGEMRIVGAADPAAWHSFLQLLGRPTQELLLEGGIGRLWAATGGQHVTLREIDYAEVLRERKSGMDAAWESIVRFCLEGDAVDLDQDTLKALVEIATDKERLLELTRHLDTEAGEGGGVRAQSRALIRLLRLVARAVMTASPDLLEPVLQNAAAAAGHLSPEVMLELLAERHQTPQGGLDVVGAMVDRMSDQTIATFVASSVVAERGATARLAQAFQALVGEDDRRAGLVELAQEEILKTPLGRETTFQDLWQRASEMLLSYRDDKFVSTDYAQELSGARTQAIDVERVSDDPPERIAAWLAAVADAEVRGLDLQLLLDLLRIEPDPDRWRDVLEPAVAHIDDLVLLGDFESAVPLTKAIATEAGGDGRADRRAFAVAAMDRLAAGHLMQSMVGHLRTVDDAAAELAKELCHAVGGGMIKPLAESLAAEERGRAFRRLTDILVSFGSRGRDAVEQLKQSATCSAAYAIHPPQQVRRQRCPDRAGAAGRRQGAERPARQAIRAIVNIGSEEAFAVLEKALAGGNQHSREAITARARVDPRRARFRSSRTSSGHASTAARCGPCTKRRSKRSGRLAAPSRWKR